MTRIAATLVLAAAMVAAAQEVPAIDALLDCAGGYVAAFKSSFSNIVAEEHFVQTFNRGCSVR